MCPPTGGYFWENIMLAFIFALITGPILKPW
jgi:hypothetical protein